MTDNKIDIAIINAVYELIVNPHSHNKSEIKRYLFTKFRDFSVEEKQYIEMKNPKLYKDLVKNMYKDLDNLIEQNKVLYPPPSFSMHQQEQFNKYLDLILKEECTEQIVYYCSNNKAFIQEYLGQHNAVSEKNAVTILNSISNPGLVFILEWPGASQYYQNNIDKYINYDPNQFDGIIKNKEVLMAYYECRFDLSSYSISNEKLDTALSNLCNAVKTNKYLENLIFSRLKNQ